MIVHTNPHLARVAEGVFRNGRVIRATGMRTSASCPIGYDFNKSKRMRIVVSFYPWRREKVGRRRMLIGGGMRFITAVPGVRRPPLLVTHGIWQRKPVRYRSIRGVEHSASDSRRQW